MLVPITAGITMSSAGYEKDLVIMVEWDTLYALRQFSHWLRHTVEKVLNRLELIPAINYCCAWLTSSSLNLPLVCELVLTQIEEI